MRTAFERNLEEQLAATLALVEGPGRKLIVVAVYSETPGPGVVAQGGLCRAVSEGTSLGDAMAFATGLRREIERIEKLAGLS